MDEYEARAPPPAQDMDVDNAPAAARSGAVATATGTNSTVAGKHETQITPQKPTYGLNNTHTAILPYNSFFSFWANANSGAVDLHLRLTDPRNIWVSTLNHLDTGTSSAMSSGPFYDRMIPAPGAVTTVANAFNYPEQMASTSTGSEACWWNYWSKLYRSFTVLGVEWELTIDNVGYKGMSDAMCAYAIESWSATDSSGKIPDGAKIMDVITWEGINWEMIPGNVASVSGTDADTIAVRHDQAHLVKIKGQYTPYLKKHLVQNDQDTKTWFKVSDSGVSLNEDLHMMFWNAPLSARSDFYMNCSLEMKFIVQFKDKVNTLRFPQYTDADVTTTFATDIRQVHT